MPTKTCAYCKEPFEAVSDETESCRKPKCVKANQRAKKRAAAGVQEVKRGRPRKVVQTAVPKKMAGGAAYKDLEGKELAKEGDAVALLKDAMGGPDMVQVDPERRPVLHDDGLGEALYEGRDGKPVEPKKRGAKEKSVWPSADVTLGGCFNSTEEQRAKAGLPPVEQLRPTLEKPVPRPRGAAPPLDVNAGARGAIVARVPAVKSLEAPIAQVDNSAARAVLAKVPRSSEEPAPVEVSASSILGRMTSKLPSAPVVVPRGTPIEKP